MPSDATGAYGSTAGQNSASIARAREQFPPIDEPAPARLQSRQNVLGHGQVGGQAQLLVDHRDAGSQGVGGDLGANSGRRRSCRPRRAREFRRRSASDVLLPAPFSPTSAWTSPARTSRSTPQSKTTSPKRLRFAHFQQGGIHRRSFSIRIHVKFVVSPLSYGRTSGRGTAVDHRLRHPSARPLPKQREVLDSAVRKRNRPTFFFVMTKLPGVHVRRQRIDPTFRQSPINWMRLILRRS